MAGRRVTGPRSRGGSGGRSWRSGKNGAKRGGRLGRERSGRCCVADRFANGNQGPDEPRPLASNRRARHDYACWRRWRRGIKLSGHEVKAVRSGGAAQGQLRGVQGRQAWLIGPTSATYTHGNRANHEPEQAAKAACLKKAELATSFRPHAAQGADLVPSTSISRGMDQVEIAMGRARRSTTSGRPRRTRELEAR